MESWCDEEDVMAGEISVNGLLNKNHFPVSNQPQTGYLLLDIKPAEGSPPS